MKPDCMDSHVAWNRRALLGLAAVLLALLAVLGPLSGTSPLGAQDAPISPEQQLVDTYAPIVMIKEQTQECSTTGEQFRPVVVDIIFGTDEVRLMRRGEQGERDREIKRNIQASDLYGLDDQHYIDLPFDPRNPGCDYERWGQRRMAELGITPSIYAFILTEPDKPGIVIQYWYYCPRVGLGRDPGLFRERDQRAGDSRQAAHANFGGLRATRGRRARAHWRGQSRDARDACGRASLVRLARGLLPIDYLAGLG
jgi:hypothetical protein